MRCSTLSVFVRGSLPMFQSIANEKLCIVLVFVQGSGIVIPPSEAISGLPPSRQQMMKLV